jgi:hypothetical protein
MLACFSSFAAAQQPSGFPPTLEVIQQITPEKGTIVVQRVVNVNELRTIEVMVVVNGKEQTTTKTITVPVSKVTFLEFNLATSRVITTEGKQLPLDEVWKRLKTNTAIALSGDSNTPAPAYLRALRADTLIIIPGQPKKKPTPQE